MGRINGSFPRKGYQFLGMVRLEQYYGHRLFGIPESGYFDEVDDFIGNHSHLVPVTVNGNDRYARGILRGLVWRCFIQVEAIKIT